MPKAFLLAFTFLFFSSAALAETPDSNLIFTKENSDTSNLLLHNQILLGFNATQVIVGDVELHAMLRFKKRYSIMIGGGYDFNFLDFGNSIELEDQCIGCNEREGESNPEGRYFWGKGTSFRLILSDSYSERNVSHFFLSLYFVFKNHDYENYYYGDGGDKHSESAKQQIFGMGFHAGYGIVKKNSMVRPYVGIGIRTLDSQITWAAIYQDQTLVFPEKHFIESHAYPSLDFGIIFLFGVRR